MLGLPLSIKYRVLLIVGLIVGVSIALFAVATYTSSAPFAQQQHLLNQPHSSTGNNTPPLTQTAPHYIPPYKIIPRNATYPLGYKYPPTQPPIIDENCKYNITINPPASNRGVPQGTIFEVSGTTDLPAGSELRGTLSSGGGFGALLGKTNIICPLDTISDGACTGARNMVGITYVNPGCTGIPTSTTQLNTWQFIIDSAMLIGPDEYLLTIQSQDAMGVATTIINILETPI